MFCSYFQQYKLTNNSILFQKFDQANSKAQHQWPFVRGTIGDWIAVLPNHYTQLHLISNFQLRWICMKQVVMFSNCLKKSNMKWHEKSHYSDAANHQQHCFHSFLEEDIKAQHCWYFVREAIVTSPVSSESITASYILQNVLKTPDSKVVFLSCACGFHLWNCVFLLNLYKE